MAQARFDELGEVIGQAMARHRVPGVAIGIYHDGAEETAGFGVTTIENPLPVDADTLFQIGSISKTYTGTIIMRLVEEGRLDLNAPVRAYVPELRLADEAVASRVTLRHLLTHTAGWAGDFFVETGPGDNALALAVAHLVELPQLTPPGAVYSYNNAGFYLAGRVIKIVTGKPFEQAAREMIFEPLGMDRTFYAAADAITYRTSAGHLVWADDDQPTVARPWGLARCANPVGGIVSSLRDQLRYARFHLGDGTVPNGARLLSPESMALMRTALARTDNGCGEVGVTWMLKPVGGERTVRHTGSTNGQQATLTMAPSRNFAFVALTNNNRGSLLHAEATTWSLDHYLGLRDAAEERVTPSEAALARFVGYYVSLINDAEISLRGGGLVLQVIPKGGFPFTDSPARPAPPPTRLAILSEDRIVALDSPQTDSRGEFLFSPDGSVAWFRYGGRIHARKP